MRIKTVAISEVGKAVSKVVETGFEVVGFDYFTINGEIFCQLILSEGRK